ncbi:MAG: sugar transferase [Candidatus Zhuqueibacterota bacterium]
MGKKNSKIPALKNAGLRYKKLELNNIDDVDFQGENVMMNPAQIFSTPAYFYHRYFIELRRAERNGYEFSLIIIDIIPEHGKAIAGIEQKQMKRAEKALFSSAKSAIRDTDVITLYQDFKIAILLPDTGQEGGEQVLQRMDEATREIAWPEILPIINGVSTFLFSYPSQEIEMTLMVTQKILSASTASGKKNGNGNHSAMFSTGSVSRQRTFDGFQFLRNENGALALESPVMLFNEIAWYISERWQWWLKRTMDFVGAGLGLVFLSPVMITVAALIKLTSPGSVIFQQTRTGFKGQNFKFYKFRTMFVDQNEQIHQNYIKDFIGSNHAYTTDSASSQKIFKITEDPRITWIGRILRRTSIDELPQLLNVLKGEMSLVGPRPPIPYEVEFYDIWHRRRFLEAKPGITGLWQVLGRSSISFNEMVRLDLAYANNWSIWLDLKILFKTVKIVCFMKGAY